MTVQTAELIVHSSNRTLTESNKTTVNDYTWEIGKTLKNVIAIEVLYAEIPNSYYNVPSGSNKFVITVGGVAYTMEIPPGNYNNTNIATTMNTALSEVTLSVGSYTNMGQLFEFGVDGIKDQLMMRHKVSHAVAGSITASSFAYPLGWLTDSSWTALVANDVRYAGGTLRLASESAIYLAIQELGSRGSKYTFGANPTTSVNIDGDHVLTRFQTTGSINYMNYFNNKLNMHECHFDLYPPLHLSRLTIRFVRPDGSLINFNGYDHGLHLRVVYNE